MAIFILTLDTPEAIGAFGMDTDTHHRLVVCASCEQDARDRVLQAFDAGSTFSEQLHGNYTHNFAEICDELGEAEVRRLICEAQCEVADGGVLHVSWLDN